MAFGQGFGTGFGSGFARADTAEEATFLGPPISNFARVIDVPLSIDFSGLFDGPGLTFAAVGVLPTGLSLSSAGVLSGTPTVEAVYSNIVIRATDSNTVTADSNAFAITIADVVISAAPRWFPLPLGARLSWLKRYTGLEAAAVSEAAGSALWARYTLFRNVEIDVHSVPGYPRPGWGG